MTAIGYTNSTITFGEDDLVTTTYTAQKFPLGLYREEDGRGYRFVQFDNGTGNVAAAVAGLAYCINDVNTVVASTGYWEVTMDVSDAALSKVRGVFRSVPTDGQFCWIQTKGPGTVQLNNDNDGAEGQSIIATSTDGVGDTVAVATAPTHRVVAWALGAVDAATDLIIADIVLD